MREGEGCVENCGKCLSRSRAAGFQKDTQQISAINAISNFHGEDRNETDKSDLSSLKYPREKDGDEDTEFFGGTKSTMS